jgi:hypothetical protein
MNERRNVPEIVIAICELLRRSQTRINLLFTMSEIPHAHPVKDATCEVMFRGRFFGSLGFGSLAGPSSLFRASTGTLRSPCPAAPRIAKGEAWWSQTGSNRRPHACKARALPAELWPRTRRRMLLVALAFAGATTQQPSFKRASRAEAAEQRRLVGLGRLELPTSRLSSARSNQLSYKPLTLFLEKDQVLLARTDLRRVRRTSAAPGACSSAKKEKRRRRNPANGAQRSGDRWPLMFLKRSDRTA